MSIVRRLAGRVLYDVGEAGNVVYQEGEIGRAHV